MSKNKRKKEPLEPTTVPAPPDARGTEDATFKDVGTRLTEHGELRPEAPRQDFINATSQELGEPGVPYRQARSDTELLGDLIRTFKTPPPSSGTIAPAILAIYNEWFERDAPKSLHHPMGHFGVHNRKQLLQHISAGAVTRESLTAAAKECRTLIFVPGSLDSYSYPQESQEPKKLPPVVKKKRGRPPKEKQVVAVADDQPVRWLRREIGLTPREVARLMSDPKFNQAVVSTDYNALTEPKFAKRLEKIRAVENKVLPETFTRRMNELLNSLPRKSQTPFTAAQVRLYKDFASGNYDADQLAERHGVKMVSTFIFLENDFIKHLGATGLLMLPSTGATRTLDEENLEKNWRLENQAIILSGAATIGGTIIGSKYKFGAGRSFSQYDLNSFEIGSETKFVRGGGSEETGGPAYEDNADDRDDYTPD